MNSLSCKVARAFAACVLLYLLIIVSGIEPPTRFQVAKYVVLHGLLPRGRFIIEIYRLTLLSRQLEWRESRNRTFYADHQTGSPTNAYCIPLKVARSFDVYQINLVTVWVDLIIFPQRPESGPPSLEKALS